MTLWDFAVDAYARPGVEDICLTLQDAHAQCVPLLLWRLWALDRTVDAAALRSAVDMARTCEARAILILRQTRRGLRDPIDGVADVARETLRESVKAAELSAERLLLDALEAATSSATASPPAPARALAALTQAWGHAPPAAWLVRLADAVGSATG